MHHRLFLPISKVTIALSFQLPESWNRIRKIIFSDPTSNKPNDDFFEAAEPLFITVDQGDLSGLTRPHFGVKL